MDRRRHSIIYTIILVLNIDFRLTDNRSGYYKILNIYEDLVRFSKTKLIIPRVGFVNLKNLEGPISFKCRLKLLVTKFVVILVGEKMTNDINSLCSPDRNLYLLV